MQRDQFIALVAQDRLRVGRTSIRFLGLTSQHRQCIVIVKPDMDRTSLRDMTGAASASGEESAPRRGVGEP
jgi:hypothetical protein